MFLTPHSLLPSPLWVGGTEEVSLSTKCPGRWTQLLGGCLPSEAGQWHPAREEQEEKEEAGGGKGGGNLWGPLCTREKA